MSRADDLRARYEAEMAVVKAEDALLAAKESGDVPREVKEQLRQARRAFRELRSDAPVANGDAVASPDVIAAKSEVQEV